ncbi:hypothetical protein PGB90_000829 [Kerria lacca]
MYTGGLSFKLKKLHKVENSKIIKKKFLQKNYLNHFFKTDDVTAAMNCTPKKESKHICRISSLPSI